MPLYVAGSGSVAQQRPRCRPNAAAVLECQFTVDQHRPIAIAALDTPPFVTWEIMDDLHRLNLEAIEIINYNIGRGSFDERAAILKSRTHRRMCAQTEMGLLQ